MLVVPKKAATNGWGYYNKQVVLCPKDETPSEVPVEDNFGNIEWQPVSYGFNIELDLFKVKQPSLKRPHHTMVFYDGEMGRGDGLTAYLMAWWVL